MPEDVKEWITVNGKHVLLDDKGKPITETGKKTLGMETGENVKESGGIKYSKTLAEYKKEHDGDSYEAARAFFKNELQGKSVPCKTENGVQNAEFTGGTFKELRRGMKSDPLKAEIIPHIPDVISTGEYRRGELHKERKDGTTAFHEYRKTVETSQGSRKVIVDIAERPVNTPHYSVYNLTRENTTGYEERERHRAEDGIKILRTAFVGRATG